MDCIKILVVRAVSVTLKTCREMCTVCESAGDEGRERGERAGEMRGGDRRRGRVRKWRGKTGEGEGIKMKISLCVFRRTLTRYLNRHHLKKREKKKQMVHIIPALTRAEEDPEGEDEGSCQGGLAGLCIKEYNDKERGEGWIDLYICSLRA